VSGRPSAIEKFLGHHPVAPEPLDIVQAAEDAREAGFSLATLSYAAAAVSHHPGVGGWEASLECAPAANVRICVYGAGLAQLVAALRRIASEPDLAAGLEAIGARASSTMIEIVPAEEAGLVGMIRLSVTEPVELTFFENMQIGSLGELVAWARQRLCEIGLGA